MLEVRRMGQPFLLATQIVTLSHGDSPSGPVGSKSSGSPRRRRGRRTSRGRAAGQGIDLGVRQRRQQGRLLAGVLRAAPLAGQASSAAVGPVRRVSSPPISTSLPPPAVSASWPAPPISTSLPLPPVRVSCPSPPRRSPAHGAGKAGRRLDGEGVVAAQAVDDHPPGDLALEEQSALTASVDRRRSKSLADSVTVIVSLPAVPLTTSRPPAST